MHSYMSSPPVGEIYWEGYLRRREIHRKPLNRNMLRPKCTKENPKSNDLDQVFYPQAFLIA